jgi:hypothetical protein
MIDFHPARAARTQRHSGKVYRDMGSSQRDGSDYDAVEIDRRVSHAARQGPRPECSLSKHCHVLCALPGSGALDDSREPSEETQFAHLTRGLLMGAPEPAIGSRTGHTGIFGDNVLHAAETRINPGPVYGNVLHEKGDDPLLDGRGGVTREFARGKVDRHL